MSGAAIIIPARYASERLPGKPLLSETGKPLIQHTYERAAACRAADAVIVATDDERIMRAVEDFGGRAVMTSDHHETGTARVAEAAAMVEAGVIVNLQGDEPEIDPAYLEKLIEIHGKSGAFASTLACRFSKETATGPGSPDDPASVKVILADKEGAEDFYWALFFTRDICAHPRTASGAISRPQDYFLHLGVYAFSRENLANFAQSPQSPLEQAAKLEQLRILEMGEKVAVGLVDGAAPGVDTPEDYAAFVKREGDRNADPK